MNDLFAFADDEGIEEVRHRLGVVGAGPAAQDERILAAAILGEERDGAQLEHRQHGRVAELELQGESDDVEGPHRGAALDGKERQACGPQRRFQIAPRHEQPLAGRVVSLVERVVEEAEADVAHPDFVGVGERERPLQLDLREIFLDRVQLAADIARRLLRAEDQLIERGLRRGCERQGQRHRPHLAEIAVARVRRRPRWPTQRAITASRSALGRPFASLSFSACTSASSFALSETSSTSRAFTHCSSMSVGGGSWSVPCAGLV